MPDPSLLAPADDVLQALDRDDVVVVDTRSPSEYLGLQATATRNGHIPSAVNVDWISDLVRREDGVVEVRAEQDLRELCSRAGVTGDKKVVVYCASGMRASATFAALESLGFARVANYTAGWQEWGNRVDTPIEEG